MENIQIPNHVAIIMDGNGRWAKRRGLPRSFGHKAGAKTLRKIVEYASKCGIKYLTVYAFSTENWKRTKEEVDGLMLLFKGYLKSEKKVFIKNNIKFLVSGRTKNISETLLKEIKDLENVTSQNTGIVLNLAFNYGGRAEIVDAINNAIAAGEKKLDEKNFEKYLYRNIPDPELLIRTSGEMRISNFLLWQIAYSEIYVTDVLWPDFNEQEFEKAIIDYNQRERRFGGVDVK